MPSPWSPPPEPPVLDEATVRQLADHFDAVARHMLHGEVRDAINDGRLRFIDGLLSAVQANLTAALVLRETYDVDLHLTGGAP